MNRNSQRKYSVNGADSEDSELETPRKSLDSVQGWNGPRNLALEDAEMELKEVDMRRDKL